jgi:hypothetical protein
MRIAYVHKQSAAQKQLYQEAHPEGLKVDLLQHPYYSAFSGKNFSTFSFITTAALGRAWPLLLKTAALLVCLHLIGRVMCGCTWAVLHGHIWQKQNVASSHTFAAQGKQSESGDEQIPFTSRRKGQSILALLAACALNSYPMLLDLTNGATHHLLQLTGTTLIAGPI